MRGQNCYKGVTGAKELCVKCFYDKICLKYALHHFLLYVVYMCQKLLNFTHMHSNVTINNVSWPHFSWPTLYVHCVS